MRSALGPLGWRPADFWSATVSEFFDAIDAFSDMHRDPKEVDAPTKSEVAKLLAKYG